MALPVTCPKRLTQSRKFACSGCRAVSGRKAGSTCTGKLSSAEMAAWCSKVSTGSSVVHRAFTLLCRMSPRAEKPGSCSFSLQACQMAGAVFSLSSSSTPK